MLCSEFVICFPDIGEKKKTCIDFVKTLAVLHHNWSWLWKIQQCRHRKSDRLCYVSSVLAEQRFYNPYTYQIQFYNCATDTQW